MARFFKLSKPAQDFPERGLKATSEWINIDAIARVVDCDNDKSNNYDYYPQGAILVYVSGKQRFLIQEKKDRDAILALLDESEGFV